MSACRVPCLERPGSLGVRSSPLSLQEVKALVTAAASWHQVPANHCLAKTGNCLRGSEPQKNGPRETWGRAGRHRLCCSCTAPSQPDNVPSSPHGLARAIANRTGALRVQGQSLGLGHPIAPPGIALHLSTRCLYCILVLTFSTASDRPCAAIFHKDMIMETIKSLWSAIDG